MKDPDPNSDEKLLNAFRRRAQSDPHSEEWRLAAGYAEALVRLKEEAEPSTEEVRDLLNGLRTDSGRLSPGSGWFDLLLRVQRLALRHGVPIDD